MNVLKYGSLDQVVNALVVVRRQDTVSQTLHITFELLNCQSLSRDADALVVVSRQVPVDHCGFQFPCRPPRPALLLVGWSFVCSSCVINNIGVFTTYLFMC